MKDIKNRREIDKRIGHGAGGPKLRNLGPLLENFAKAFEGMGGDVIQFNGEPFTPVSLGEDKQAELLSNENHPWDLSSANTVTFEIDDKVKSTITFSDTGEFIADITAVTLEEAIAFMQDAITTAGEDNEYWVEEKDGKIRIYSLNTDMTVSKVEVNDTGAGEANTVLGFNDTDVDYGKQGLGLDLSHLNAGVSYDDLNYVIGVTLDEDAGIGTPTNADIYVKNKTAEGFEIYCSDNTVEYGLHVTVLGVYE